MHVISAIVKIIFKSRMSNSSHWLNVSLKNVWKQEWLENSHSYPHIRSLDHINKWKSSKHQNN